MDELKRLEKEKEISQDEHKRALDRLQKITDVHMAEIDKLSRDKEKELMEV
jgi:ribosome recycling factor